MNRPTRNTLFGCVLCLVLAGCWSCAAKAGEDVRSANFLLPYCEKSILDGRNDFWTGVCSATSDVLLSLGSSFSNGTKYCPPDAATVQQATRVIVNYLNHHPERLQDPYKFLAVMALKEAWPCK